MTSTRAPDAWTAADLGAAMIAHYTSTTKAWRKRSDGVEGVAAYRDGDNEAAFRIVEARGVAMDARRDRTFSAKQYAEDLAGVDLRTFMAQWGRSSSAPRPAPAPARTETFPPAAEVLELLAACVDVDREPRAAAWVASRGLDVGRLVDAGELRAVPAGAVLPRWARQAGRTWPEAFGVVAALVDAHGAVRSLHARRTVEDAELSKTSSPAGHTTRGLVMADRMARALLAGGAAALEHVTRVSRDTKRPAVVLTEGLPSFAAWCADASDADEDAPAVMGILSGAWTPAHAARIPDGARVLVDVDGDAAGDAYAMKIAETFAGRAVELGRMERV